MLCICLRYSRVLVLCWSKPCPRNWPGEFEEHGAYCSDHKHFNGSDENLIDASFALEIKNIICFNLYTDVYSAFYLLSTFPEFCERKKIHSGWDSNPQPLHC